MPHRKLCPRALIVEDDPDTADTFAALIQSLGCEASVVTDPRLAVETAERIKPQVVFLDIGMPALSGNDLARMLRAKYGWNLRIVAVTAHGNQQDRARGRQAGF